MPRWKKVATRITYRADQALDRAKTKFQDKLVSDRIRDPVMVQPYISYGTHDKLFLLGRILEDKGIKSAGEDDSLWKNFRNAWRRFDSDEVAGAKLRASFRGQECELESDSEGFFRSWFQLDEPLPDDASSFQEVEVTLEAPLRGGQDPYSTLCEVMVPKRNAEFGIISDMDDTVLQTGATNVLSMAKKSIFGNARTRLPFAGVTAFYQALHRDLNPVFYVSSSPWNLYDVLADFLDLNDIPVGPLTLRDWGISPTEIFPTSHGDHKIEAIRSILDTYPDMSFILIGDSGQEDPEIYRDIVHDYSERILGVYIRDVTQLFRRTQRINELAREVEAAGSQLNLAETTTEAAEHAAERGWIDKEWLEHIRARQEKDEQQPVL